MKSEAAKRQAAYRKRMADRLNEIRDMIATERDNAEREDRLMRLDHWQIMRVYELLGRK